MKGNQTELIKIACPYCCEKNFSFSRNAISEKNGISFVCPECEFASRILLTSEGDIYVTHLI